MTDLAAIVTKPTEGIKPRVTYRVATPADELHVVTLFSRMLTELEPLGHDVLPTEANIDYFWEFVFLPALDKGTHGIILAFVDGDCVGATFFTPEFQELDVRGKRAIAHGQYVLPEHRRNGISWSMQQMAHSRLSKLGYTSLISCVMHDNVAGQRAAQEAGAVITGYLTTVNLTLTVEDK